MIAPIEGSPAAKAGILAKDIILKVGEKPTKGMDINQVVSLIRGRPIQALPSLLHAEKRR